METDKPARWFRLYYEFATDPNVQMLSEVDQRRYIMLLCIRCGNGNVTLLDEHIAWFSRISLADWRTTKKTLVEADLITEENVIPSWEKRQFSSDKSVDRVASYRERRKAEGLKGQDWIPKKQRARITARDQRCVYCGAENDLTMDHMIPTIRGGGHNDDNLQVCCRKCNADKRHMTHEEYISWPGRVTLLSDTSNVTVTAMKPAQRTETETETERTPTKKNKPKKEEEMPSEHSEVIKHFCDQYQERFGTKYLFAGGKDAKLIAEMLKVCTLDQLKQGIDLFLADKDEWLEQAGWTIGTLKSRINRYLQQINTKQTTKSLNYL